MVKETISVLMPRTGKKSKANVDKTSKKRDGKVGKNGAATTLAIRAHGAANANLATIENANIGNLWKSSKVLKSRALEPSGAENFPGKKSNVVKNENGNAVSEKMAAVRIVRDEARGHRPKKRKVLVEPSTVVAKKEKKIKPMTEPIAVGKKEKKIKLDVKRIEDVGAVEAEAETKTEATFAARKIDIAKMGDLKLTKSHILRSVMIVQELAKKKSESKKSILPMGDQPLLLQVTCIKIAKTPRRQIRVFLPHSMVGPLDDVALFVPDLEKGRAKDYEKTVDHWRAKLEEQGVDFITEIIPLNRVKTEYSQFETKRKLSASYDHFLASGKICGHLTHLLGKTFLKRKGQPTPVKLERDNLKEELLFGLRKSCLEVHKFGDSHTLPVGKLSMNATDLAENVWAVCEELARQYPGGWQNIRAIRIKSTTSLAIPIYSSLKSKNSIVAPVVKPKRPRAYETVEGELTTVLGNATVKLTPEGAIKMERTRDFGDEQVQLTEESDDEKLG